MSERVKYPWIDLIKAFSVVIVILIHVSSPVINMAFHKNAVYWWIGDFYNSLARVGVPGFLMITGATLLGRSDDWKDFYKRRLARIFYPFLFWLVIYIFYRWFTHPNWSHLSGWIPDAQWTIRLILHEGVSKHFWYIYMILFVYLWIPFLNKLIRKISKNGLLLLVVAWFLVSYLCKSLPFNMYDFTKNYDQKLMGYFMHSGYLLLGYYLFKYPVLKWRWVGLLVYFLCALSTGLITGLSSYGQNKLDLSAFGYFTIIAIAQNVAFFLFFKDLSSKNGIVNRLSRCLSDYSYGIYLAHILVLGILFHLNIFWTMGNPLITVPFVVLLTLAVSFFLVYLFRKVPLLGRYVG